MSKCKIGKRKILLIVLLLLIFYALPFGMYAYYHKIGADITDVGMGLYLAFIPLLIEITSIVYSVVFGEILETAVWVVVCGLPTIFMPMFGVVDGLLYVNLMGIISLICSSIGLCIQSLIKKLLKKRK